MKNNGFFPMFVDLSKKKIIVIGAGKIASRRIKTLLMFCSQITVVSKTISKEIEQLPLTIQCRSFQENDLEGMDIAIIATDDVLLNEEIAKSCSQKGILKNVSSNKELCDFYFPGVISKENVVIGISTGGENPAEAKKVRKEIENILS